jgi:outer membrane protein OmpA-like peptidoglycan-associated protein
MSDRAAIHHVDTKSAAGSFCVRVLGAAALGASLGLTGCGPTSHAAPPSRTIPAPGAPAAPPPASEPPTARVDPPPDAGDAARAVDATRDSDGDGVPDIDDKCPALPGSAPAPQQGCPAPGEVVRATLGIASVVRIAFAPASKDLDESTTRLVDEVRELLAQNPQIKLLEVIGHASRDERDARRLSEARARAVVKRLVKGGIAAKRLSARGVGATEPLDANAPSDSDRCVDFRVLDGPAACDTRR